MINTRAIVYSKAELRWIERNCKLPRKRAHQKFIDKFERDDVTLDNFTALCKRNNWITGRTGQFPKGTIPPNKGKKMPYNENCAKTQFKKGHKPHNTKFVGRERLSKNGYIEISVAERNPHTGSDTRYVLKHKYLWEQKNGRVPEGMCLKCLDGDRHNTDPSNWVLISRGALPFLNNFRGYDYDNMPADLKPTILALAKVRAAAKKVNNKKVKK